MTREQRIALAVGLPAASLDSGSNPFTDNTHTDSSYIVADLDSADALTHISKRFGVAA